MGFMNINKICESEIKLRCKRLLGKREKEGMKLC